LSFRFEMAQNVPRMRQLQKGHSSLGEKQDRLIERWFSRYDANHNDHLDPTELVNLLGELYPEETVEEAVVRAVMTPQLSAEGVSRTEVMAVVKRYGGYVRNHAQLHELLGRHAESSTSLAARSQLLSLLTDFAKSSGLKDTSVADEDADYVLGQCVPVDGSSNSARFSRQRKLDDVSPENLLSAVALWQACRLEAEKAPGKSSACALL